MTRSCTQPHTLRLLVRAALVAVCCLAVAAPLAFAGSGEPVFSGGHAGARSAFAVFKCALQRSGLHGRFMGTMLATWYGPGFYGHNTGCGGKLAPSSWGVAHRTLPCGTMLLLRYRGRIVSAPVIDRGPYSGADLDLTALVARKLGVIQHGSGRLSVSRLSGPSVF